MRAALFYHTAVAEVRERKKGREKKKGPKVEALSPVPHRALYATRLFFTRLVHFQYSEMRVFYLIVFMREVLSEKEGEAQRGDGSSVFWRP